MKGTAAPHPSSDNFWSEPSNIYSSSLTLKTKKKQETNLKEFLYSVDEAPDFYDPYSDLNLFLSQKIKQQMQHCGFAKKWSLKIQELLLEKIRPEFQAKFPQYRLGVAALKKTFEKIAYYSQQIQSQKEAITQDGKLNIHFFIKENLKQYLCLKNPSPLHPCHFAHQLAMKMSECIATIDGIRPKLDQLTKIIWSIQRHLISGKTVEQLKSPYDEYDKVDKLIVKTILEITAKEPQIGHNELEHKVKESIQALHDLPCFSSLDLMINNVSALLAEKLYHSSPFHTCYFAEQKKAITHFILRHSSLCKTAVPAPQLSELVRRIIALYTLVSQLPKNLTEQQIKAAVYAACSPTHAERPSLPQAVYAFIAAELVLMQKGAPEPIADTIWAAYRETALLPELKGKETDVLEIVIWKLLSETEGLLEKLPYRIGQKIEGEIANILIDNPQQSFAATVHETVQFFKQTRELVQIKKWTEIERKIHSWVIQGDMLCRWIRLDDDSTLLTLIVTKWKEEGLTSRSVNHPRFISEISQEYLRQHPEISLYAGQLAQRIWILYKYAWYALFAESGASSYDRFIHWHLSLLLSSSFSRDPEAIFQQVHEIVTKTVPLAPFDAAYIRELIHSFLTHF